MNGKWGLSLALCPPIPQQTISWCEIRFINVGFQQCGHDQFKQHQCPPPFLSPCSFICAEPVHTVFLLSLSTSPWRRKKRDRNGKNIIHQLTPSAGSVPVQSDQIKDTCQYVKYFATVREHSPWGVSMFWPAEHCRQIQQEQCVVLPRNKYFVPGQANLNTVQLLSYTPTKSW